MGCAEQVDMYEDNDAMRAELETKRRQADSLQEGLKKMVHLSLERMLHERVGSQVRAPLSYGVG
jgi:hypothetical protein